MASPAAKAISTNCEDTACILRQQQSDKPNEAEQRQLFGSEIKIRLTRGVETIKILQVPLSEQVQCQLTASGKRASLKVLLSRVTGNGPALRIRG